MKRIFVSSTISGRGARQSLQSRHRLSVAPRWAWPRARRFPVGDLGDATSTGFHVLGTIAVSGNRQLAGRFSSRRHVQRPFGQEFRTGR